MNIDIKKWVNEKYILYEEIFEFKECYCLEFCIKKDLKKFIDTCLKHNVPFTFYPEYKIAICIEHLKLLITKQKLEEESNLSTTQSRVCFSILP